MSESFEYVSLTQLENIMYEDIKERFLRTGKCDGELIQNHNKLRLYNKYRLELELKYIEDKIRN